MRLPYERPEFSTHLAHFVMARLDRAIPLYCSLPPIARSSRAMMATNRDFRPSVSQVGWHWPQPMWHHDVKFGSR
jgi:hypothetical protein